MIGNITLWPIHGWKVTIVAPFYRWQITIAAPLWLVRYHCGPF